MAARTVVVEYVDRDGQRQQTAVFIPELVPYVLENLERIGCELRTIRTEGTR